MSTLHPHRYPGESAEYRRVRNALLEAEVELKQKVEAVAALRRELPLGGEVPVDYEFEEPASDLPDQDTVRTVRLSQLFEGKDTLVVYSFMYGPEMQKACPMCSSFLDALNGNAPHLRQRVGLAVVAKSPVARLKKFARERGWNKLRLVSSEHNRYSRDYFGEDDEGQDSMLNVFVRRDGKLHHFWGSEVRLLPPPAGENQRHIDLMWPLWNVLDLTPEGRGGQWYPSLERR